MNQRTEDALDIIDHAADALFDEMLNEPPSAERDVVMSRINNASASARSTLRGVHLEDVEAAVAEQVV